MKRIFEDILDDIDLKDDDDVVSKLDDNDVVDLKQFGFRFDITIEHVDIPPYNRISWKNILRYIHDNNDKIFNKLKQLLNIYADSFWVDNDFTVLFGVDKPFEKGIKKVNIDYDDVYNANYVYTNAYFNFDSNLNHLLNLIYRLENFQKINRLNFGLMNVYIYQVNRGIPILNFNNNTIINALTKSIEQDFDIDDTVIQVSNIIYEYFYKNDHILKFKGLKQDDANILEYIKTCVRKFIKYNRNRLL